MKGAFCARLTSAFAISLLSNLIWIPIYLGCFASGGVGEKHLYPDIFEQESGYK